MVSCARMNVVVVVVMMVVVGVVVVMMVVVGVVVGMEVVMVVCGARIITRNDKNFLEPFILVTLVTKLSINQTYWVFQKHLLRFVYCFLLTHTVILLENGIF